MSAFAKTIFEEIDTLEYILFRITLLVLFVAGLVRMLRHELRRRR